MQNRVETPPLLKAENVLLGIRHEREAKLLVTYAGWDDAKVVLDSQVFELPRPRVESIPSPLRATSVPTIDRYV